MRTREDLLNDLTEAEINLPQDFPSTGQSYRLRNTITTYFGANHNFSMSYEQSRGHMQAPMTRLIEAIRDYVDVHGYDWWEYHKKPSFLEKYFDANPKTHELIKISLPYIVPSVVALVLSVIAYLKGYIWIAFGSLLLLVIPTIKILYGFLKK